MWSGYLECSTSTSMLKSQSDGSYHRRSRRPGATARRSTGEYENDQLRQARGRGANAYQHGDTWYRDMRSPGFNGGSGAGPRQQRAVAGEADSRRQALRRGDGQVLVAGHHGQRSRGAARRRRTTRTSRGFCSPRTPRVRRWRASCARIPERLLQPGEDVQSQGFAGRDRSVEVVPRGHRRGRPMRCVSVALRECREPEGCSRRRSWTARQPPSLGYQWETLALGAMPTMRIEGRSRRLSGGLSASLRRHRFGRNHGAGTRHHDSVMAGVDQAARGAGELPGRHARFLPRPRSETEAVRGIDRYVTPESEISEVFGIEADSWSRERSNLGEGAFDRRAQDREVRLHP